MVKGFTMVTWVAALLTVVESIIELNKMESMVSNWTE